ncbi:hypothetical protein ACXN5S_16320 [Pseudoroseicyclus sp. H15]
MPNIAPLTQRTTGTAPRRLTLDDLQAQFDARDAYYDAVSTGERRRGSWDPADPFPGGVGVEAGNWWEVSAAGSRDGLAFKIGDGVQALVAAPSTTVAAGNWDIKRLSAIVARVYTNFAELKASFEPPRGPGAEWRDRQGHHWRECDAGEPAFNRLATPHGYHLVTAGGVKLRHVWTGPLIASALGWVADDATDNAEVVDLIENILRLNDGGSVIFDGEKSGRSSRPFLPPSFSRVTFESPFHYTNPAGPYGSVAVYAGQLNRTDVARFTGSREAAYDVGALQPQQRGLTVGGRWNNVLSAFTNPKTWVPQVGDNVFVFTNDDSATDPSRPVPTALHLRKLVEVDGYDIMLDAGVAVAGNYVIVPACRDLGYDRGELDGAIGRVEIVEDVEIYGRIKCPKGIPLFFGAADNPTVKVMTEGRELLYANGIRNGDVSMKGTFTRTFTELKLGSENPHIRSVVGQHIEDGEDYTAGLFSTGENCRGGRIDRLICDAPDWNGGIAFSVLSPDFEAQGVRMITGATGILYRIGSSTRSAARHKFRGYIEGPATMAGEIVDINDLATEIDVDLHVKGQTTAATSVNIGGTSSGILRALTVEDNGKAIRINKNFLTLGKIIAPGPIVNEGVSIAGDRIYLPALQLNRETVDYQASFATSYAPARNAIAMQLGGNLVLADPTFVPRVNEQISLIFTHPSGGPYSITFAGLYRGIEAPGPGGNAKRFSATFEWTGTVWAYVGGNGAWKS